jgi:hypothetical protein
MRWLILILLVSLAGLLFAAAGLARHIWVQHKRGEKEASVGVQAGTEADDDSEQ